MVPWKLQLTQCEVKDSRDTILCPCQVPSTYYEPRELQLDQKKSETHAPQPCLLAQLQVPSKIYRDSDHLCEGRDLCPITPNPCLPVELAAMHALIIVYTIRDPKHANSMPNPSSYTLGSSSPEDTDHI